MKIFSSLLITLFLNYLHVNAIKFDCRNEHVKKKDYGLIGKLDGKVYWIIKYLGFNNNTFYDKMLGRVSKKFSNGNLAETTYFILNKQQQTLLRLDFFSKIHDDLLAFHATRIDCYKVKYNRLDQLGNPYSHMDGLQDTDLKDLALVHYDEKFDFSVAQSCHDKRAIVEIGDRKYRKVVKNITLWDEFEKRIFEVLTEVGIQYEDQKTEPNELLDIFQ